MYVCTSVHKFECMYLCMSLYVCKHVCMYLCMHVFACLYDVACYYVNNEALACYNQCFLHTTASFDAKPAKIQAPNPKLSQ